MKQKIDCLFIGHNEMEFEVSEKAVGMMGKKSGAYRAQFTLNYIQYNGKKYSPPDAFNHFYYNKKTFSDDMGAFNVGNMFSSTIAYLGTYLQRRGYVFDYVNSFQDNKDALAQKLALNNILTIAIPTTIYISTSPITEIISFIRKYNASAKIIVGGPFIFNQMQTQDDDTIQYTLKTMKADFYINNAQGETALVNILNSIKNNSNPQYIENISYRNGTSYITTSFSPESNLLSENMVDWNLFPKRNEKLTAVRTATSCPFSCSFCSFPGHEGKYQTADIEALEKEFDMINSLGNFSSVYIIDDTFNVPQDRFKSIMKMMIKKNYKFKWNCNFRCQFTDREMVELMKASGCEAVYLGIESANNQVLKNMNKATTVEKYLAGCKLLNEYDIPVFASFITGFPGETDSTVKETIDFIEETKPLGFRTHLWFCNPFTPIWKQKEEFKLTGCWYDWSHETMDSITANNHIETIFKTVKNSLWIPQYNFNFQGYVNLWHRGLNNGQINKFISGFNMGIKERLDNPDSGDISLKTAKILKTAFE